MLLPSVLESDEAGYRVELIATLVRVLKVVMLASPDIARKVDQEFKDQFAKHLGGMPIEQLEKKLFAIAIQNPAALAAASNGNWTIVRQGDGSYQLDRRVGDSIVGRMIPVDKLGL